MKNKGSVLRDTSLIYFVLICLFIMVRIVFALVDFNLSSEVLDVITTVFVQVGIMFLLPIFLFSKLQKQKVSNTFKQFNYNKISLFAVGISVLIGFLCYFLNITIASFFGNIIGLFGFEQTPSSSSTIADTSFFSFLLQVLVVAVFPAICEETTHRGLLLNGFSSMGIKRAVIFSSLLFGLMHLNINQFFYATVLGFIIAVSVIASKSIFPAMIIHFMNNFLSTYFMYAKQNNWFGLGVYNFFLNFLSSNSLIGFFFSCFFFLAVILTVIVLLFVLLLKQTRIKKVKNMLTDIAKINKEYEENSQTYAGNGNFANLYSLNNIMSEYNIKSLSSMVFTEMEIKPKPTTNIEKLLLISCFVVGGLVTAFTFIWGII